MADLNFSLLPWQQEVFKDKTRFKVVAAGRRCGKSRMAAVTLLIEGSPELSSWVDKKEEEHLELMVHCKFLQVLARSKRKDGEEPVATVAPQEIVQSFDELPF